MACWVVKAYRMEVPYCVHVLDCICCFLFFAHTVFVILRKGATATVLSAHVLVDCLTIPWLCLQKTPSIRGSSWLSPGYLRVYFVMSGTSTLAGSSNLEWLPEIAVKGAQTAVEFLGLIVLLAGTMWTLELLGETSFDDVYFAADMGDISFLPDGLLYLYNDVYGGLWRLLARNCARKGFCLRSYTGWCHVLLLRYRAIGRAPRLTSVGQGAVSVIVRKSSEERPRYCSWLRSTVRPAFCYRSIPQKSRGGPRERAGGCDTGADAVLRGGPIDVEGALGETCLLLHRILTKL